VAHRGEVRQRQALKNLEMGRFAKKLLRRFGYVCQNVRLAHFALGMVVLAVFQAPVAILLFLECRETDAPGRTPGVCLKTGSCTRQCAEISAFWRTQLRRIASTKTAFSDGQISAYWTHRSMDGAYTAADEAHTSADEAHKVVDRVHRFVGWAQGAVDQAHTFADWENRTVERLYRLLALERHALLRW